MVKATPRNVQFVYRRMYIPGTNLSPYMVARGRQPSLPSELERKMLGDALPAPKSLNEHVQQLNKHLQLAQELLLAARERQLAATRESFNQDKIEIHLQPGERVRLWKRVPLRHGADPNEIASKLKIFNTIHVVVRALGSNSSRYLIRSEATGKETEAHISQLARMRSSASPTDTPAATPDELGDVYERLKVGTMALVWRACDPKSVLRVVEVLSVDRELQQFKGWFYVHGGSVPAGGYVHERPLVQARLIPEWVETTTGQVLYKPNAAQKAKCTKITDDFDATDSVVITHGFQLQAGGKVAQREQEKADAWLRKQISEEPRVVLALSQPNEREKSAAAKL